jgi:hypothetical protein
MNKIINYLLWIVAIITIGIAVSLLSITIQPISPTPVYSVIDSNLEVTHNLNKGSCRQISTWKLCSFIDKDTRNPVIFVGWFQVYENKLTSVFNKKGELIEKR